MKKVNILAVGLLAFSPTLFANSTECSFQSSEGSPIILNVPNCDELKGQEKYECPIGQATILVANKKSCDQLTAPVDVEEETSPPRGRNL